jgi:hypothetical protein
VGIYNIGDAPVQRSRSYSSAGAGITDQTRTVYAPRLYLSVGLQL